MARNGTNEKSKVLTPKQRRMAEALVNPDFDGTITELCEQMGVPRRTYYNWLDNPAFREYMSSLIEKYADSELAMVWKSLLNQCSRGNIKAIKLYFERRDMVKKESSGGILDKLVEAVKNV